jgi:hypothetical protein
VHWKTKNRLHMKNKCRYRHITDQLACHFKETAMDLNS